MRDSAECACLRRARARDRMGMCVKVASAWLRDSQPPALPSDWSCGARVWCSHATRIAGSAPHARTDCAKTGAWFGGCTCVCGGAVAGVGGCRRCERGGGAAVLASRRSARRSCSRSLS
eukprot:1004953-Pleurochrysis_carterae.AAC.2